VTVALRLEQLASLSRGVCTAQWSCEYRAWPISMQGGRRCVMVSRERRKKAGEIIVDLISACAPWGLVGGAAMTGVLHVGGLT